MERIPLTVHRNRIGVRQIICEYLKNSQLHGYEFILAKDRSLCERIYWAIIAFSIVSLTMGLIISGYLHFVEGPTVTSEQINGFPILDISFPAVAICTSNRISRKSLLEFSEFILNATVESSQKIGTTIDQVFDNLRTIGNMYHFESSDDDYYKMDTTHNVLKYVYDGVYPIKKILKQLTPKCENIIKRCKWQGHFVDCKKLFSNRKTYMGNCCMFNYQRPDVEYLSHLKQNNESVHLTSGLRVKKHGTNFGLTVLIDQMPDDYVYTINSFTGSKVLLFNTQDFPDIYSCSIQERFILPEEEMFLTIHPILITGSNSMKHFATESKHCVFVDEVNLIYKNFYTLSECLLTCYLQNIIKLCGCFPPQYTNLFNYSECLLEDIACLKRWKVHWNEQIIENNRHYSTTSSMCPMCYSRCNIVRYRVHTSSGEINPKMVHRRWHDLQLIRGIDTTNHSILYVNFGSSKVVAYEQYIEFMWYELLANFGGLSSLTFGASLMSIIELIYFATGKFGRVYWERKSLVNEKSTNGKGLQQKRKLKHEIPQLYWNEFAHKIVKKN